MTNEQLKHRLLSRTVKTSTCWFYTGTKASGYGTITIDGKREVVHRLMYQIEKGKIPDGMELDHLCGLKHCLNPEHLQAVTHLENTRRGPQYKGQDQNHLAPSRKKTFLLYIHNERFKEEKHKSQLVNSLLEKYYADKNITLLKSVAAPEKREERVNLLTRLDKEKKMPNGDTDYKLCKHGAYPQFCKFAKPGRPCK